MNPSRLTLFDLDNTLLDGDSDYTWAQFLIGLGILDGADYERRNDAYYADYLAGRLDIVDFLDFQLAPLARHPLATLHAWRDAFVRERIVPIMLPAARSKVAQRLADGDLVAIVTATNSFVTRPIADAFGVRHLIATEPEFQEGRYTGRVDGVPAFREGKLTRLNEWLAAQGANLGDFRETWFYSDSRNDLPLLQAVTHPVAVDPDPVLQAHAVDAGWLLESFREPGGAAARP
jgi:HAD superfamily hydrolase (TIGR01490 family)